MVAWRVLAMKDSVTVRVHDSESFGQLCVALSEDRVMFAHAGFRTLLIWEYAFERLPLTSKKLFTELTERNVVEVIRHPQEGKARRRLPSPSDAAAYLEKFSKEPR